MPKKTRTPKQSQRQKATTTVPRAGLVTRNPNILPEFLRPQRDGNPAVRALARLFNDDDPHSLRALFKWACDYVGVPESLAEPILTHLRQQASAATGGAQGSIAGLCKAVNKYERRRVRQGGAA